MKSINRVCVLASLMLAVLAVHAEGPAKLASAQLGAGAVTLRYDPVPVEAGGLESTLPGAYLDLTEEGVAVLETPIALESAGTTLPPGQYRLRVHRADAETWVLLLEGSGTGRGPAMPDAVVTRVPLMRQAAVAQGSQLRVELRPSADALQLLIIWGGDALAATFQAG